MKKAKTTRIIFEVSVFSVMAILYAAALLGYAPLIITAGRDINISSVMANTCLFVLLMIVLYVCGMMAAGHQQSEKEKTERIIDSIGQVQDY